jgi:hypothetical protein
MSPRVCPFTSLFKGGPLFTCLGMVNAPEATNTLILVPKPAPSSALISSLRPHFERQGHLRIWAPLHGLGRVIAIYALDEQAASAKAALDRTVIEERPAANEDDPSVTTKQCVGRFTVVCDNSRSLRTLLRVYAGPRTPEALLVHPSLQDNAHLPVPVTDKNFLISPPGSPPVGWEQIREDPPNVDTLADDLMRALEGLGATSSPPVEMDEGEGDLEPATTSQSSSRRETVILTAAEDESTPSVLVSDLDGEVASTSGLTIANTPHGIRRSPTPRPVGDISAVRATVDSMAGSSRITPTARPPF